MTRHPARMMASPFARQRPADPVASMARGAGIAADAQGPAIRPVAAQLLAGAPMAPPGAAVQRVKVKDVVAKMKSKSHTPHGGSKDSNTHAAQQGHGQKAAVRRKLAQIEAAEKKRATAAGAGAGKGSGKTGK